MKYLIKKFIFWFSILLVNIIPTFIFSSVGAFSRAIILVIILEVEAINFFSFIFSEYNTLLLSASITTTDAFTLIHINNNAINNNLFILNNIY